MLIEKPFPLNFQFELVADLPSYGERLWFPGGSRTGGFDGLSLRFKTERGSPWIGTVAFGGFGRNSFSGILSTPDPDSLCVVAEGSAVLVNAQTRVGQRLEIVPVLDVRVSIKHRVLVFADYTHLLAVGSAGTVWQTRRLAWNDLTITGMDDDFLYGCGWDLGTDSKHGFAVDLASGNHRGGAYSD